MGLKLFNTMGREMQEFVPINKGEAFVYACGPTVYNYAHIGNLRTYIFEDILRRVLEFSGYKIKHVMNVTDVGHLTDDADSGEDKMEKSARETGRTVWDIAKFYTDAFFSDIESLNIEKPEIVCRATDHVGDMIDLIKKLEDKGYTYVSGGNVYFSIDKFADYGKMALLDRQNLQAGSRIEVDSNKRNPHDFVLWFTKSKFENHAMLWDSPWGKGYPGWHIECSAMSMKYLGESFDIHCGGIDHINVHHTNEIAQSEAASGKKWVNYWLHGEFLVMNKSKMAKSAGNFITLSTLKEKGYDPLDYRYFCLSGHYRSQLQFSFESLDAARTARVNLVDRVKALNAEALGAVSDKLSDKGTLYLEDFKSGIEDDLNCPKALAVFWTMLKDQNLEAGEKLSLSLMFDKVTGLELSVKKDEKEEIEELDDNIRRLIDEREEARKSKDFARSDSIRSELKMLGIEIKDTPDGTVWKKL
ncbi:MAG: cysteine--tRNA ligase [Spirochaetales bacterium]|nr:cysteine--tRNA ligase [Spirochaetales bacterium]